MTPRGSRLAAAASAGMVDGWITRSRCAGRGSRTYRNRLRSWPRSPPRAGGWVPRRRSTNTSGPPGSRHAPGPGLRPVRRGRPRGAGGRQPADRAVRLRRGRARHVRRPPVAGPRCRRGPAVGGRQLGRATGATRWRSRSGCDNEAALALYERHGFVREGYLHRHYPRRTGEVWDAVVMGLVLEGYGALKAHGGERGHLGALAVGEADVAEAALAGEGVDQHRHGVVVLGQVGRVDLAGVAGEHDLGALADPGEDRLERGRLEVLGLVDDDERAVQRPAPQVGHRLERELLAVGHLVEQGPGVGVAARLGERHERVGDRGHPRVELLVEAAGQEPELGLADGHDRPVDGQLVVAAALHHLLEAGGEGEDRLAGAGHAVEGDDPDLGVEQQVEGELLLLGAGSQAPRLERAAQRDEPAVGAADQRRLAARPGSTANSLASSSPTASASPAARSARPTPSGDA